MPEGTQPLQRARVERWTRVVPALLALHAVLAAALWARPGLAGVYLWYVEPSALALAAVVTLGAALLATLRRRGTWTAGRVVAYAGLAVVAGAVPFYRTYPSSYDERPSEVHFRLPLDGPVKVAWGGPTPDVNYHVVSPDQRWAYDLLVVEDGNSHRSAGQELTDYFAYDRDVRAPAAGLVYAIHDGEPDGPPGRRSLRPGLGNHVVIEVAPRQFLFVVHLRRGSVVVDPGTRVAVGQLIGRVGNSGTTTEPHVHLHLQDTPRPYFGEGIPFDFFGYRHDGRLVARGMPRGGIVDGKYTGDVVEQTSEATDGNHGAHGGHGDP